MLVGESFVDADREGILVGILDFSSFLSLSSSSILCSLPLNKDCYDPIIFSCSNSKKIQSTKAGFLLLWMNFA